MLLRRMFKNLRARRQAVPGGGLIKGFLTEGSFSQRGFTQRGFTQRGFTQRGFTLIELLAVIAIIAILMALLAPSVLEHIRSASEKTKLANAREVYSAAAAYATDVIAAGKVPAEIIGNAELERYFGETDGKTITAVMDKNSGAVLYAFYDGARYPKENAPITPTPTPT